MARRSLSRLSATLSFAAAAEAVLIVLLFRKHLPSNPLLWTLIRTWIFNHVAFIVWIMGIYPYFFSPLRHLPHPTGGYPFFGLGLALFKKPPGEDFLRWMTEIPNDGILMFRGFGHQPRLVVTTPKALGEVLVQRAYDYKKPAPIRGFLRRILGNGLIIVEGDEHKFQRKHIMPVFSFRHIKELYPMMWKKAVALTQGIESEIRDQMDSSKQGKSPTGVAEINHWANKVTMDIIGVAGLGREFNALKNSDDPLIQNYEELLEPTFEKLTFFAMQIVLPQVIVNNLPWRLNERMRVVTGNLKSICTQLVREKRSLVKTNSEEQIDILSVLLRSNNFSDEQLVDQLLTFLAAGHETTSSAFTWVTYLLATHPDIQKRLREEVRTQLPTAPAPDVDLSSVLESMPLLNAVCNETIRLYPTIPLTIRDAIRDTTILDQFIPKGTSVHLIPWATNRNPHFWGPDASEFKPERWIDAETGKPNKTGGSSSNYNILTFLHGPRSCIGKDFAMAELRCLVAAFVGAFDMELADPNEVCMPHGVITTKPKNGMNLRLKTIGSW